jgi:hypothetical protein
LIWYRVLLPIGPGEVVFYAGVDQRAGQVTIVNGEERLKVPMIQEGGGLVMDFGHYDSRLVLKPAAGARKDSGGHLQGAWTVTRRGGKQATVPALAYRVDKPDARARYPLPGPRNAAPVARIWKADFGQSGPAKIVLTERGNIVGGTIMTATGDYRFWPEIARDP